MAEVFVPAQFGGEGAGGGLGEGVGEGCDVAEGGVGAGACTSQCSGGPGCGWRRRVFGTLHCEGVNNCVCEVRVCRTVQREFLSPWAEWN